METSIYNLQGKATGKLTLPGIFETKVSSALLHEVVVGLLANQRAGTHSVKTRAEVRGGGKKPWKQKGTGNARSGSNTSPLWRKGGIIFGPKPRSYFQNIPQQKRQLSLQMALSVKAKDGELVVVDAMKLADAKTKSVAAVLKNLKITGSKILLVVDKIDQNLKRGSHNIENLVVAEAKNINAYQVLWAKKMLLTPAAVELLEKRQAVVK